MKTRVNKNNGTTKSSGVSIGQTRSESPYSRRRKRKPTEQVGRNDRGGNRLCIRRRSSAAGRVIDFHGASSLVNHKSKLTPIRVNYIRRHDEPERTSGQPSKAAERGAATRLRYHRFLGRGWTAWRTDDIEKFRGGLYILRAVGGCQRGTRLPRLPANIPVQRVQVIPPSMNGQVTQQSLCSLCVNATCLVVECVVSRWMEERAEEEGDGVSPFSPLFFLSRSSNISLEKSDSEQTDKFILRFELSIRGEWIFGNGILKRRERE